MASPTKSGAPPAARRRTTDRSPTIRGQGQCIRPVFQPIIDTRNGTVSGFEALARLVEGDTYAATADFLVGMPPSDRLGLFETMLDQSLAAMMRICGPEDRYYVSVNAERFLFLEESFFETLTRVLHHHAYPPDRLVIELLEEGQIDDEARMIASLGRLRALGIRIALDDIGTAHASLINIKNLPVDVLKLDQGFARGLSKNPHDLQFALSLISLARGLGKSLIVEGVETKEILDALMILGVEFVQGYGIARPMPTDQVRPWLDSYDVPIATRSPTSLLGSFASHLTVVETCRILMHQPLPLAWKQEAENPDACEIGRYFNRCNLHDTPFGRAHRQFHRVMTCYSTDYPLWKAGAEDFARTLTAAIAERSVP